MINIDETLVGSIIPVSYSPGHNSLVNFSLSLIVDPDIDCEIFICNEAILVALL
jgi:hypothetical protein